MKLKTITITICEACLNGEGKECHTPGCALFLHRVDLPIHPEMYTVVSEENEPDVPLVINEPKISICRQSKKCGLFDGFNCVRNFLSYKDEPNAIAEAKAWFSSRTKATPEVIYPYITKIKVS